MALSYKARRRWSLIILLVGLPVYIMVCVILTNLLPRPNIILEFIIYVVLGIIWIFPFKKIFLGVGQIDPNETTKDD
ncbi:DUF2842 domain-containing protein [Amylibacter sp.]|jgi:predicted membrane channel-forming protein YqfA (hemolysin III family)|nr:DUF2842 domain-containing protein [Amylibacter sp.]MDB0062250.1 DUF2842 domain-containing protein [bacterium]MDA9178459.1 DUF2842 domain-containing protein [Amylibacter sp.]MDA9230005.1 DUF2842 domain-containing protein [Amylibacter sp.]MDA9243561.1 DUF2842 domain-containing protein [Amylibacter sp.]|tara:strand:- start:108 stop:338 length:231 start_codon:yes stop_codon:yes gene_type:complete